MNAFVRLSILIHDKIIYFVFCLLVIHSAVLVSGDMVQLISVEALHKKLECDKVLLVDVREPAEFKTEHISKAILVPLSRIGVQLLPESPDEIVVYCRSGRRSEDAARVLMQMYPHRAVSSLEGGIVAWKQAGYQVKSLGCRVLPLERQTQIGAGILVVAGTLLAAFVSPQFLLIPCFVGCGLIFAGLTGWCGIARVLAIMPWNN